MFPLPLSISVGPLSRIVLHTHSSPVDFCSFLFVLLLLPASDLPQNRHAIRISLLLPRLMGFPPGPIDSDPEFLCVPPLACCLCYFRPFLSFFSFTDLSHLHRCCISDIHSPCLPGFLFRLRPEFPSFSSTYLSRLEFLRLKAPEL